MDTLMIRKPDDCHLHLREGNMLKSVLPWSSKNFGRAVVMPNLKKPLLTANDVIEYHHHVACDGFQPKMTIYLTPETSLDDLRRLKEWGEFAGGKWYPKGVTHNSTSGSSGLDDMERTFAIMEEMDIPLLVHGEDPLVTNMLDRERSFIEQTLQFVAERHQGLRIVMEHITTLDAITFVKWTPNVWATITPHHLHLDFDDLFLNGRLQPHFYCLPVPNRHRRALLKAAASGNPKFFAGTDSAPHLAEVKEADGVPGCFTAPFAMEHYAEAFDGIGSLDRLEDFTSTFGAQFYGWPLNEEKVILRRRREPLPGYSTAAALDESKYVRHIRIFVSPRQVRWETV